MRFRGIVEQLGRQAGTETNICFKRAFLSAVLILATLCSVSLAQDPYVQHVHNSVDLGRRFLLSCQLEDGAYPADSFLIHPIAVTSAATLALLKSGSDTRHDHIRKSLTWLRALPENEPARINEISLMLLVLTTANDPADHPRIRGLAQRLVNSQLESGGWPNRIGEAFGDLSASEFALIALQDARNLGVGVPEQVWARGTQFWKGLQHQDGGWPEFFNEADRQGQSTDQNVRQGDGQSSLSGSLAGVAILSRCQQQLNAIQQAASPDCCLSTVDVALQVKASRWLAERCRVAEQRQKDSDFVVDHLYGVERGTRQQGAYFPGEELWFRRGALTLMMRQHRSRGFWPGNNQVISTSYSLLYLASGLSPSAMNSIRLSSQQLADVQQRHSDAVWKLTEQLNSEMKYSRLLSPHEVDLRELANAGRTADPHLQAPVLFLTGDSVPEMSPEEFELLSKYLDDGGLLLAAPKCSSAEFDTGIRELARRLGGQTDHALTRVPEHHPIYRVRYSINPKSTELWELNAGCRTSILYSPEDLSCNWSQWHGPVDLAAAGETPTDRDRLTMLGLNVIAYANGSRFPTTRVAETFTSPEEKHGTSRGLLQVALVRHGTGWNMAPGSLVNLMKTVNDAVGQIAAPIPASVQLDDPELFHFPVLYWHGNKAFQLSVNERAALKNHLERGGVLLADSCCQSAEFDRSFRAAMDQIYPDAPLQPIPDSHEILSGRTVYDVTEVSIRVAEVNPQTKVSSLVDRKQAPLLEGIERSGRYVVIYSKYDLSCAMEAARRTDCEGYAAGDALKIGTNLIVYALLQELREIPGTR
ncbi:DUF4159 domain-containing protein [Planctomicrobium sp. SH527]|uniref:DUF4159 domain-containing protein n=1 Tax=Planctomicrobium sp. SH527 TaxID=3448123 RepID=UPI003F5B57C6